jgi:hypothetical protein
MALKYSLITALLLSSQSALALDINIDVERRKIPMIVSKVEPVIVAKPIVVQCVKLKTITEQVADILAFWRWFEAHETEYTQCIRGSEQIIDHYEITAVAVTGERVKFNAKQVYPINSVIYF